MNMPKHFDKVIDQVSKLSQSEQDALAAWIREELASEREWDARFARSEDELARLADEALSEHRAGMTLPLSAPWLVRRRPNSAAGPRKSK